MGFVRRGTARRTPVPQASPPASSGGISPPAPQRERGRPARESAPTGKLVGAFPRTHGCDQPGNTWFMWPCLIQRDTRNSCRLKHTLSHEPLNHPHRLPIQALRLWGQHPMVEDFVPA
ncbi:hypothetical protein LBMAG56_33790 [Verrucomicrobiota bacterium]|nr:hypothetical protein LBMAG56_33790 [Verrucomicrobiota bacterium]